MLYSKAKAFRSNIYKNQGGGGTSFKPKVLPRSSPCSPSQSIAGDSLWCHNQRWHEASHQTRETYLPGSVSKNYERTSGTARSWSPLQVVPGSSVLMRASGFVLANPELSWTDQQGGPQHRIRQGC